MTNELATVYDPAAAQAQAAALWRQSGAFDVEGGPAGTNFCIVIPPPNVTAALHLGHALNNTLQDILIRYRRMTGLNTLWMPGTDHAGIATQTVVEKRILAEEGRRRTDFARDEFIARVQAWKDEYETRIIGQLEQMGCSCDWRRTRFTMDAVCAAAVRETFYRLFADELIYRGKRLVNWDVATQTVLADDEVEHETVAGHFWYLRYPLASPAVIDGRPVEHVTVATTRPETMLGDTAVAMNPRDRRAGVLVGQMVRLPLVGRLIPIIADEHVVMSDPTGSDEKARFSTGFLKVTPAHDPDDYAIGQRHGLAMINIMAPDGTISDRHGWTDAAGSDAEKFLGMDRFEAREAIVEWFRKENLLEEVREYTHDVGHSYRSHVPIEPYLSDQWYVAVKKPISNLKSQISDSPLPGTDVPANSLAGFALAPLLDGRLKFTPDRYAKNYQGWLENLRDWPISRQLWWGHRIPVWSRELELPAGVAPTPTDRGPDAQVCAAIDAAIGGRWAHVVKGMGKYMLRVEPHADKSGWVVAYVCTAPGAQALEALLEEHGFAQDPDVLDTWFSSALWPFSTLGWPQESPALKAFYPGNVLCTAREIITLWVSRMVMMGQYCAGDIPFSQVLIHAMIQDGEGRKMSKSLGNGIDPVDIIDSHGADAMRFTLASMTTQTQDVRMPVKKMTLPDGRQVQSSPKFDVGRNFCNKRWNASRFAMMNLAGAPAWETVRPGDNLADAWILSRLQEAVRSATASLEAFRFNELTDTIYRFVWNEFCDWYLEIAKSRINGGEAAPKAVVAHCLDHILRLLHPVAPFITETIWAKLNDVAPARGAGGAKAEPVLAKAAWPAVDERLLNAPAGEQFDLLADLIRQIRNVRTQHNVAPARAVDVIIEAPAAQAAVIAANIPLLASQANLAQVTVAKEPGTAPAAAGVVTAGAVRCFVLNVIDLEAEKVRLAKQAEKLDKGIEALEKKLGNAGFLAKADPAVVES
ncbi:MAG: valine--tRNA ligase, partial [Planctomycetota bacterium]|nr:valine--tRNA ligase [Planctomycetota bacterium]